MKFTTNKGKLEIVISSMQPFLEKKDSSAITSHIYLEVVNNNLTIKATDYEMGLNATITDISSFEDGKATTNGANLLNIIRRLKNEDIIFEVTGNNLVIKQNKSSFKLPMYNPDEYPSSPNIQNLQSLNIDSFNLINSLKNIIPAIDNNNPKFELNGALIDIKDQKINLVATDTRRLAITKIENINNSATQIIIPKKAVIEIQKLFFDKIDIKYDDVNLIIENENFTFFTKLINGKFPDYGRIIPNSIAQNFEVNKNAMVESIKLISSLQPNIKITFEPNSILFESVDEDNEAKTQIEANLNISESFYFAVSSKFLLDFLSCATSENVEVGFNANNLPFSLSDKNFTTIVMPVILDR